MNKEIINMPEIVNKVDSLSWAAKMRLWIDALVVDLQLSYKNIALNYLNLDFQKFTDKKNIKVIDFGEDWNEQGRAQRYNINLSGIYRMCYLNPKVIEKYIYEETKLSNRESLFTKKYV
jgi:hypothetical protein